MLRARRNLTDRIGDPLLRGLSGLAAALAVAVIVGIVYEVIHIASPAISAFGIGSSPPTTGTRSRKTSARRRSSTARS